MGLSFAIPIDVAMNVSEQLESSGFVTRGWLGVVIQEVNKDLAESFGLDKPSGALVAKVLPGSPAEAAGFRDGDIITEFNGQSINLSSDLPHQVGRVKPGTKARVDIVRNGDDKVLTVNIGTLPDEARAIKASSQPAQAPQNNRLNIMISDLSQDQKNNLAVSYGILVQKVMAGSAANAGLVAGDVITMLNGKRVDNVQVFEQIVSQLPAKRSVPMRIVRRGSPVFIPLKLNEE